MIFATGVSSATWPIAAVAVFFATRSVMCAVTPTTSPPPPPAESVESRTAPPTNLCAHNSDCSADHGFNRCENHRCTCDENFYHVFNSTSGMSSCHICSQLQDNCAVTHCCQNPRATFCVNNVCVCKPGMEDECLNKYTPTLRVQLANTLSVSFAFVFLAVTFVAVVRKLFSCSIFRCDSLSRVSSNSSLNEFVKQKMQNRPPCYDDIEKDRKVPINPPPPAYSASNFDESWGSAGHLNPAFSISDDVDGYVMAPPPNYSTFTTVTSHNHRAITDQRHHPVLTAIPAAANNNEIILTQPIYDNSPLRRT